MQPVVKVAPEDGYLQNFLIEEIGVSSSFLKKPASATDTPLHGCKLKAEPSDTSGLVARAPYGFMLFVCGILRYLTSWCACKLSNFAGFASASGLPIKFAPLSKASALVYSDRKHPSFCMKKSM